MASSSRATIPQAGPEAPQTLPILTVHLFLRTGRDLALGEQEQVATPGTFRPMPAEAFAKEALGAVPRDGPAHAAAGGKPQPIVALVVPRGQQTEERSLQAQPRAQDAAVVRGPPQSIARPQAPARAVRQTGPYAATRFRPFWRRRFSTRRPPLVRIRTRKPWVLFRLRLFGWYVRFISMPVREKVDPAPGKRDIVYGCALVLSNRGLPRLVCRGASVLSLEGFGVGKRPQSLSSRLAAFPQVLKSLCKKGLGRTGVAGTGLLGTMN
jgi:hypothetical protein